MAEVLKDSHDIWFAQVLQSHPNMQCTQMQLFTLVNKKKAIDKCFDTDASNLKQLSLQMCY